MQCAKLQILQKSQDICTYLTVLFCTKDYTFGHEDIQVNIKNLLLAYKSEQDK